MAASESETRHGLSLDDLPWEVLYEIVADFEDKETLHAFALANKTCNNATTPFIFRNIKITVHNPAKLQRDVDALLRALSRTQSNRHVRALRLDGALRLRLDWLQGRNFRAKVSYIETGLSEIIPKEGPVSFYYRHSYLPGPVIKRSSPTNEAWVPVASLVRFLPGLEALVYDCSTQFPPALLTAVHEHPRCKLHHLTFRFQSPLPDSLHPYELAVATSPRLHHLKVICCLRDSSGRDDFTQEAVMELAGLAPNLRGVEVVHLLPGWAHLQYRPRGLWPGLPGVDPTGRARASLSSLSIRGLDWATQPNILEAWAQRTDFSCLRHLVLGAGYGYEQGKEQGMSAVLLGWIVENCSFPCVDTLSIRLDRNDIMAARPGYAGIAVAFVNLFEPLHELSVCGSLEPEILDAILSRHGPVLRKLSLFPWEVPSIAPHGLPPTQRAMPLIFGKAHLLQIQSQCPELRELTIPVKRTKSDSHEAEIYKSFGKMERLESLVLILDCSNWRIIRDSTWNDDGLDEIDQEFCMFTNLVKKGHIREAYLNCAVDETLAQAIWNTIRRNKMGVQIQTLRLWTIGGVEFGGALDDRDKIHVVENLSRSWLFERVRGRINVRELGRRARERRDEKELARESTEAVQIFRRIWPRKKGCELVNWREDWASLPLQVEDHKVSVY